MTGHINVMVVLHSCTDSPQFLAGSCTETFPTPCDVTLDIGNMQVEEDLDMIEKEAKVNVKTEKGIGSENVEWMDIKDEVCVYSEEEDEDIDTEGEEDVDVKK